jgi:hypothetical protein
VLKDTPDEAGDKQTAKLDEAVKQLFCTETQHLRLPEVNRPRPARGQFGRSERTAATVATGETVKRPGAAANCASG